MHIRKGCESTRHLKRYLMMHLMSGSQHLSKLRFSNTGDMQLQFMLFKTYTNEQKAAPLRRARCYPGDHNQRRLLRYKRDEGLWQILWRTVAQEDLTRPKQSSKLVVQRKMMIPSAAFHQISIISCALDDPNITLDNFLLTSVEPLTCSKLNTLLSCLLAEGWGRQFTDFQPGSSPKVLFSKVGYHETKHPWACLSPRKCYVSHLSSQDRRQCILNGSCGPYFL